MTTFSFIAFRRNLPYLCEILNSRFLDGIQKGYLPESVMLNYIQQDLSYLERFAEVNHYIAKKAPQPYSTFHNELTSSTIADEEMMLRTRLKITLDTPKTPTLTQANKDYQQFLLTLMGCPYQVAIAGILPCLVMYHHWANYVSPFLDEKNTFRDFISIYTNSEFALFAKQATQHADDAFRKAPPSIQENMLDAFDTAAQHEANFIDACFEA